MDCDGPESCTNITSIVGRDPTNVDYDTEDDETCAGDDFDHTEDKFDLFPSALFLASLSTALFTSP